MEVISRKDAKELGLRYYYTGKLCSYNHRSKRFISNRYCCECKKTQSRRWRNNNKGYAIGHTKNSREKIRARGVRRRQSLIILTPPIPYDDKVAIKLLKLDARRITEETSIKHVVDHIHPLCKGGVNHTLNMQILTDEENAEKYTSHDGNSGVSYEDFMLAVSAYA